VEALLLDNILLLLPMLLLPLQRPIVVILPLSSSCIDEWCSMESSMDRHGSAVAAVLHTGGLPGRHGCAELHT
jgi:hypothetical protein